MFAIAFMYHLLFYALNFEESEEAYSIQDGKMMKCCEQHDYLKHRLTCEVDILAFGPAASNIARVISLYVQIGYNQQGRPYMCLGNPYRK